MFCCNFRRWLLVILAPLNLAHLGCVHMKTLAKSCVLWPGIDSDMENTGKDFSFFSTWSNPTKTPSLGSPVRNSFWNWRVSTEVKLLNCCRILLKMASYALSFSPNFCNGNHQYSFETIIYNPGTGISDNGPIITWFECNKFVERTCICVLSTVAHHREWRLWRRPRTGWNPVFASHPSSQNLIFANRNQFC